MNSVVSENNIKTAVLASRLQDVGWQKATLVTRCNSFVTSCVNALSRQNLYCFRLEAEILHDAYRSWYSR